MQLSLRQVPAKARSSNRPMNSGQESPVSRSTELSTFLDLTLDLQYFLVFRYSCTRLCIAFARWNGSSKDFDRIKRDGLEIS